MRGFATHFFIGGIVMNLKLELVRERVAEMVAGQIENIDIDLNRIANTKAIAMLGEIQAILQNKELENYQMIDAIENIFSENKVTGAWWEY